MKGIRNKFKNVNKNFKFIKRRDGLVMKEIFAMKYGRCGNFPLPPEIKYHLGKITDTLSRRRASNSERQSAVKPAGLNKHTNHSFVLSFTYQRAQAGQG